MFINTKLLVFSLVTISVFSMPLPINYFIARAKLGKNLSPKHYKYNGYINSIYNYTSNYTNNYTKNDTNNYTNNNTKYDNQTRNKSRYDNDTNYNNHTENKNNTDNTTSNVKILYSYGDLYEYKAEQTLHLYVNVPINPKLLTNITFITRNRTRLYRTKTDCQYEKLNEYGKVMNFKCLIDLSYISKGDYFLFYFFYDRHKIEGQYTLITIKEAEKRKENKTEQLELIGIFSQGYEHSFQQNITLFFNNNVTNINLITNLTISNTQNESFLLPLYGIYRDINNSVLCLADFLYIPSDYYRVQYLVYNYSKIYPLYNIGFNVYNKTSPKPVEEEIRLLNVSGEAYKNYSKLSFTFNKNVSASDFDFYLKDYYKSYLTFNLYYSFCSSYNRYLECEFNFTSVPKGLYSIIYFYKYEKHETNVIIEVKEKEIFSDNDLIEIYHNFKKYKDNQVVFFSFYGRNPSKNLAYIVLNDGYSKINVLQIFGCQIINYNYNETQYDLKCNLNLTYVGEGEYTLSEYYINNVHYYTKNKINVIVE